MSRPRILCDLHHGDLYRSLQLLFNRRLGWELYRPVGMEWFTEGYWALNDKRNTAEQYLGLHQIEPKDVHGRPVTESFGPQAWINHGCDNGIDGVHQVVLIGDEATQLAVRLETAKEMKFDIVLSSVSAHFPIYERFRQQYCPHAKHIYQSGNMHVPPAGVLNFLNSTTSEAPHVPNHVRYHQEFDLAQFPCVPCNQPRSIVNLMHFQKFHNMEDWNGLLSQPQLADWPSKNYGAGNADGSCGDIPMALQNHGFLWHVKKGGDGYGYNIHNAFASGRPVITRLSHYRGQTAAPLMTDLQTVIDLDVHSMPEVARNLIGIADDYETWRERVYKRFQEHVNFDAEFEQIKTFLDNLQ